MGMGRFKTWTKRQKLIKASRAERKVREQQQEQENLVVLKEVLDHLIGRNKKKLEKTLFLNEVNYILEKNHGQRIKFGNVSEMKAMGDKLAAKHGATYKLW